MGNFKNLKVWQIAKNLAVDTYKLTSDTPGFEKDYRFRDQIRAAAISISSNIAEGDELGTNKQSIRHFHIAKGSTAELITQLIIAYEVGYISEGTQNRFLDTCDYVSSMLNKLIIARKTKPDKP